MATNRPEQMTPQPAAAREELDAVTAFLHAGLMFFGLLAWLTGEWAGDYKKLAHLGFSIHKWLGLGLSLFLGLRLLYGLLGPDQARFGQWMPFTRDRLRLVWEDLLALLQWRLPERQPHQGLAGLWESFGLAVFTWQALTGSFMFFALQPGQKARGMVHLVKELHEAGSILIPLFLGIHVAAVLLHALAGKHLWRRMFFLKP